MVNVFRSGLQLLRQVKTKSFFFAWMLVTSGSINNIAKYSEVYLGNYDKTMGLAGYLIEI